MPITHHFDEAENLVLTKYEGIISNDDYAPHFERVLSETRLKRGWVSVIDLTAAEDIDIDFIRARVILTDATVDKMKKTGYAGAVFFSNRPLLFGMSRIIITGASSKDGFFNERYRITENRDNIPLLVAELRTASQEITDGY